MKLLLITPPFTQLNTPYPATAYIKGFLNTQEVESEQMDLGLDTILAIFSRAGLSRLFDRATSSMKSCSLNAQRIYALRDKYVETIDPVIAFLQDRDTTLAHLICERNFLPEASKFSEIEELDWAFGTMGIRDLARHLATLYLEDIGDFISEVIDPYFGFSRYAERLSLSARSFDELYTAVLAPIGLISEVMLERLAERVADTKPDLICFSVPFPGNLFAALKCGQWLKQNHPDIRIAMGGGYPNTELRSLTDSRIFEFVDFITLDDGEAPLMNLMEHLKGIREAEMLKRTFVCKEGQVIYHNGSIHKDIAQEKVGTPDYTGLALTTYLSVIQLTNPMHRMWSDGRWNKLTMAHGCYWGKCTFCDISLSYIKDYEASSAALIVDRMEELVTQTGERGFHFVDEAAPPALMKAVALEILQRKLVLTWWTNIRFEKSFHFDLCRLLAASGCVAVSGGLEVASDRLLELIDKGVTVEQVTQVNDNFTRAGIMVHAYLMYGFPTQTDQETIDSLEVVRQMFESGVMQSGFWHRFAMTAHSPVGIDPQKFSVSIIGDGLGAFANNDLEHSDQTGGEHDLYSEGLKKSLFNYMHGVGLDFSLNSWFDHTVPATLIPADLINSYLEAPRVRAAKPSSVIYWLGGPVTYEVSVQAFHNGIINIQGLQQADSIPVARDIGNWLVSFLTRISNNQKTTYGQMMEQYEAEGFQDFTLFWFSEVMELIKKSGLVLL